MKQLTLIALFAIFASCASPTEKHFVIVEGAQFTLAGKPYYFVGTNFWYGANLGMPGEAGDRERLIRELDLLKATGLTNLRIMAASEGPFHANAVSPTFKPTKDSVNTDLLIGLDFLLAEMGKRDMKAVIFLNNFWEWSGGMNQWGEWYGNGPGSNPQVTGDWTTFIRQSAKFYPNEAAQTAWREYLTLVISRTNSITGEKYTDDPTIMSWQLANEPRPDYDDVEPFVNWIHESAGFIKALAPNQLVSTGNEGSRGANDNMDLFVRSHSSPNVDYLTFHMWAKNWGWYDAANPDSTIVTSMANAETYIREHVEIARQLNKPITMEEFGLGRDFENHDSANTTTYRDRYLGHVFSLVEESMTSGSPLAGTNFWAWGGYGVSAQPDFTWKPGDPFMGDPPQEPQGLNSVFAGDTSTLNILKTHAEFLRR